MSKIYSKGDWGKFENLWFNEAQYSKEDKFMATTFVTTKSEILFFEERNFEKNMKRENFTL